MFTGIIECLGKIVDIKPIASNVDITVESPISDQLKVDQSVSHNGVCLTVVKVGGGQHIVTAIDETLKKTNLGTLTAGTELNLERCTQLGSRLDGHIVQGHIDETTICLSVDQLAGSWKFSFELPESSRHLVIPQGSICINGTSLTVSDLGKKQFSVAIIPYTYQHTTFKHLQPGDTVNLEYDVIGKYVARLHELKKV